MAVGDLFTDPRGNVWKEVARSEEGLLVSDVWGDSRWVTWSELARSWGKG